MSFLLNFIPFYSDKFLAHGVLNNYNCYTAIRSAVEKSHNSGVDVKAKIGNELIGMLEQIFKLYYHEYGKDNNIEYIDENYKYLQKLLGFSYQHYLIPHAFSF